MFWLLDFFFAGMLTLCISSIIITPRFKKLADENNDPSNKLHRLFSFLNPVLTVVFRFQFLNKYVKVIYLFSIAFEEETAFKPPFIQSSASPFPSITGRDFGRF